MSSKNFYGLTGDVTIDGGILNVANTNVSGNVTSTSLLVSNVATLGTTKTFVVRASGGAYYIDEDARKSLELHEGQTYIFDISHSSLANSGIPNGEHPLEFATQPEGANSSGYITGISSTGTAGTTGAKKTFVVSAGAPTTLYYYCTRHSGMGNQISISPEAELIVSGRIVASGNVEASKITASANVEVTGNVVASTFVGDGSLLTGISTVTSSGLQVVTDNSPTTTNTIEFTNPTTSLRASSNIVATGNVTADHFIGDGSQLSGIVTSVSLEDAVNTSNITSNTVQFTNTSTSLTASGNVEVAGNVVVSGNVEAAYFVGDGSKLSGIVTSVTLEDAVNAANTTSNTVQFTNTSTSLTASGNVEVTGNVVAAYFVGDGSKLTGISSSGGSGTSEWTKTVGTNELYYTAGSVGISNANPIHDLSVGSNLYVDDDATDGILKVTGNVNATYFVGDGSRLINLPAAGGSSDWTTSGNPTNKIYFPQNPGTTPVSVGIMNAAPTHTLSVGSNLFVDDTGSNVLVVDGDITAESMFLGALGIKPSYPLETVTDAGNVTPHTISFTNPTLGFTTASNVEIGGALVVGKGTLGGSNLEVGNANLFVNTELTRVGIGTDEPAATLHVNGSLAVDGPLTFGTVNVAAQHGLEAITAVSNTTPLTIELQNVDTSLVTTGNVEVGGNVTVSEKLTVSGNVVASQNITISGNTFYTSPMSMSVDSNVVAEYTGPHDRPLRKYPEVALTSASQGGYVASGSSNGSGSYPEYTAFDGVVTNSTTGWASDATYASGTGISTFSWNGSFGEYLSLELPKALRLQKMFLKGYEHSGINYQNAPRDIKLYGSNNETNWVLLKTETDLPIDSITNNSTYININATEYYKYIRLQITKTYRRTAGYTRISELEYYGHEEGSGSLDTTLKTVYNVPATTGTQLEVYYDAKDLDNGNAPTNPVNLSPNTNNATLGGDPQVSNGAFVFDGTGDYITGTHGLSVPGQPVHSQCVWFKITGDTSDYQYISIIGTTNSTNQAGLVLLNDGTTLLGNYYGGDRVITTITQNVWYHAVLVYTGTTTEAAKYYINGVEVITTGLSGAAPITPTITGTTVRLGANTSGGQELNGSIANFRLFSKALNADQVRELYDYQKDYFLGSKSQVTLYKGHLGVGVTEPSGQLELAGDERIQEYPPRALTGYETLVEGHGVFCVDFANWYSGNTPWGMYKKNNDVGGQENVWYGPYQNNNGYSGGNVYTGTDFAASTTSGLFLDDVDGTRYYGAWTTIAMPYDIYLKQIHIHQGGSSVGSSTSCAPEDGVILGSNDGTKWYHVHTFTGLQYGGTAGTSSYSAAGEGVVVNAKRPYSHYALITTRTHHNDFTVIIGELRWFGTPGPTTLDKGSLTLGRSLDVPRVSRYDVDTETPRPEKLVVDYDTTVNSSPTDISGKGNHGVFKNDSEYSPADKAFKFDGDNDYIQTGSGSNVISGSAPPFTASVWVNNNSSDSTYASVFSIEPDTYGTNTNVWFYILSGKPTLQFENNYVEFYEPGTSTGGATRNIWHHLVVSYNGNSTIGGRRCWLNGVEQTSSAVAGSGNLTLGTTRLTLGVLYYGNNHVNDMTGKISNFKLYNVALEPSEVKKLYRLGRTGRSMVISDTAVGIGKVPEAQLDVRGTISCNGAMRITGRDPDFLRIRMANVFGLGESEGQSIPDTNTVMDNGSAIIEYTGGQSTTNNEGAYIWLNGDTMGIMNTGDTNTLHWYDGDVFPDVSQTRHWYISTSGAITNSSDLTLKNNIRYFDDEYDISNSMLNYSQIKFCKYNWKRELKDPSGVKDDFYGVIAQEIEPLFPEMIKTDEGGLKMIQQERLQYISYHMIANLIQKNAALEARILALENA